LNQKLETTKQTGNELYKHRVQLATQPVNKLRLLV